MQISSKAKVFIWYTPNRLFDIAQGMEHGWLIKGWTRSWNRPEWFYDNVDRLVEIGQGCSAHARVFEDLLDQVAHILGRHGGPSTEHASDAGVVEIQP